MWLQGLGPSTKLGYFWPSNGGTRWLFVALSSGGGNDEMENIAMASSQLYNMLNQTTTNNNCSEYESIEHPGLWKCYTFQKYSNIHIFDFLIVWPMVTIQVYCLQVELWCKLCSKVGKLI